MATENELATVVVDTAYRIHTKLGPGLFESVYQRVLVYELQRRGLRVDSEVPFPVVWDTIRMDIGFKADIVVDDRLILELKSVEQVSLAHKKQLLTYLRVTNLRLGLLINFGADLIKHGIHRVVNHLPEP